MLVENQIKFILVQKVLKSMRSSFSKRTFREFFVEPLVCVVFRAVCTKVGVSFYPAVRCW